MSTLTVFKYLTPQGNRVNLKSISWFQNSTAQRCRVWPYQARRCFRNELPPLKQRITFFAHRKSDHLVIARQTSCVIDSFQFWSYSSRTRSAFTDF